MKLSAIIKFIILIGIASIVFSCTDDLDINNNYQFSICATLPELQEGTKATATDVIRMSWSENDAISVINVTTGKVLGGSLVVNAAGTSSVFSGTITGSINKDDKLAFIYPSQNYSKEGDFEPFIIDYSMQTTTCMEH